MALRGESIGAAYVKIFVDGTGIPNQLKKDMAKASDVMEDEGIKGHKSYRKGFDKEEKKHPTIDALTDSIHKAAGKMEAQGKFLGSETMRGMEKELKDKFGKKIGGRLTKDLRKSIEDGMDIKDLPGHLERNLSQLILKVGRAGKGFKDFGGDVDESSSKLRKAAHAIDQFGEKNSKFFGKGARNNFVNLVGILVEGAIKMGGMFVRMGDLAVQAFTAIGRRIGDTISAFNDVRKAGGSVFQGLMAGATTATEGLGAVFASIATTGPIAIGALVAALALLEFSLGPVIATVSLLGGAITALAASISFAIVGAIAPLVGLLAPLAIGVGTVVLAFVGMDKATKKLLKESLKPLMDGFRDLGAVARQGLFYNLQNQTTGFGNVFKALRPLVRQTGRAISDVITGWLDLMRGPGFTTFIDSMTKFVPDAIRSLGRIAGNVFSGLGGVFVALEPSVTRFLGWLEKITGSFTRFANSPEGRQKMQDFFDKAGDSASKLGTLIDRVAGVLRRLMDQGRGTGDSFIDNLSAKVQDFIDYLDAHPDAISNWFSDAQDLANKIGRITDAILKIIDALDNPTNRRIATAFFSIIETMARGAARIIGAASAAINTMARGFGRIKTAIGTAVAAALRILANLIDGFALVIHAGAMIPGPIGAAFRKVEGPIDAVTGKLRTMADHLTKKHTVKVDVGKARNDVGLLAKDISNLHDKEITITTHMLTVQNKPKKTGTGADAAGRLVTMPRLSWTGEDGPEAIVPLNRSLNRVDPSVRWLSAIAQGKIPALAKGGMVGGGKTVDASGWTIVAPSADPRAVASEVINRLVATGY